MREMIQMVVVLTILSCVSGILLAAIESGTKEQIAYQQLKFVKGPAIRSILEGASNDPIVDRFKLKDGEIERDFFVGVFDGAGSTGLPDPGDGALRQGDRTMDTAGLDGAEEKVCVRSTTQGSADSRLPPYDDSNGGAH